MRFYTRTILFLIFVIISSVYPKTNIDAEIKAIRNAPVAKRFRLMNAFKQKIIKMKERERIQAITQLKSITKSKYSDRAIHEIRERKKYQEKNNEIEIEDEEHQEDTIDNEIRNEGQGNV